jgi:hypothetical protein
VRLGRGVRSGIHALNSRGAQVKAVHFDARFGHFRSQGDSVDNGSGRPRRRVAGIGEHQENGGDAVNGWGGGHRGLGRGVTLRKLPLLIGLVGTILDNQRGAEIGALRKMAPRRRRCRTSGGRRFAAGGGTESHAGTQDP